MSRENARAVTVLLIMIVVPASVAAYVGGYLSLSGYADVPLEVLPNERQIAVRMRAFDAEWLIPIYEPAAELESKLTGIGVMLYAKPKSPF